MTQKVTARALGGLQVFIGLGAVGGGLAFILDPQGGILGMGVEMLARTPFPDYLIPGIVLFAVNGLGSLAGAVLTFRRSRAAGPAGCALGLFLVLWILAQVVWFRAVHSLHVTYFSLGILEGGLALRLMRSRPGG